MKKEQPAPEPRLRGRPRGYEPDAALEAAMNVFWARGYAEASLDDLTGAMGITRPSLYAAFGDKQALFAAAIARYEARIHAGTAYAFRGKANLHAALSALITQAITMYAEPAPHARGCFLGAAAVSEAPLTPAARKAVSAAIARIEVGVAQQINAAGWRAPGLSVPALTRQVVNFLYGASARARLGVSGETLLADGKTFLAQVLK
jgi:TetR/AcrR family transcriptional regulator, copper-responsive repressor